MVGSVVGVGEGVHGALDGYAVCAISRTCVINTMSMKRFCRGHDRDLPLDVFNPSAVRRRVFLCLQCERAASKSSYLQGGKLARLRRESKAHDPAGAALSAADYKACVRAHRGRCFITGAACDPSGLAGLPALLLRGASAGGGMPVWQSFVPVAKLTARACKYQLPPMHLARHRDWLAARSPAALPPAASPTLPPAPPHEAPVLGKSAPHVNEVVTTDDAPDSNGVDEPPAAAAAETTVTKAAPAAVVEGGPLLAKGFNRFRAALARPSNVVMPTTRSISQAS